MSSYLFDTKATPLVWATVDEWMELNIPPMVEKFEEFEAFLKGAAKEKGI